MKFEYSDFYKFIASLGIALISLAVLVPWLFLREPFDLLLKNDEIVKLTPLAQSIIRNRQSLIVTFMKIIPWFSSIVFGCGIVTFVLGGWMWLSRTQKQMDKTTELNIKMLEQQLVVKTRKESTADKVEEIQAVMEDQVEIPPSVEELLQQDDIGSYVRDAYRIEEMVDGLLRGCLKNTHTVLRERRLGVVSLDIVLLARSNKYKDYTIEVKHIRKGFKYNWLRDNVLKTILSNEIYQKELGRDSIPVLLVVASQLKATASRESYLKRIEEEVSNLAANNLVFLLTEDELSNLKCAELKSMLKI